ncbi:MAG: hypothetical protein ACKVVT_09675 [Dehalococcoidia bacterium]
MDELFDVSIRDLVRRFPRALVALADLGITPRYAHWTVRAAVADLRLNPDRVAARLRSVAGSPA